MSRALDTKMRQAVSDYYSRRVVDVHNLAGYMSARENYMQVLFFDTCIAFFRFVVENLGRGDYKDHPEMRSRAKIALDWLER